MSSQLLRGRHQLWAFQPSLPSSPLRNKSFPQPQLACCPSSNPKMSPLPSLSVNNKLWQTIGLETVSSFQATTTATLLTFKGELWVHSIFPCYWWACHSQIGRPEQLSKGLHLHKNYSWLMEGQLQNLWPALNPGCQLHISINAFGAPKEKRQLHKYTQITFWVNIPAAFFSDFPGPGFSIFIQQIFTEYVFSFFWQSPNLMLEVEQGRKQSWSLPTRNL